jgi:hypothetical protein
VAEVEVEVEENEVVAEVEVEENEVVTEGVLRSFMGVISLCMPSGKGMGLWLSVVPLLLLLKLPRISLLVSLLVFVGVLLVLLILVVVLVVLLQRVVSATVVVLVVV